MLQSENRFVTGQLIPQPPNKVWFWIGANRTSDYANDWGWTDGSPFDYEKFCPERLKSNNYDCLDVGTNMNHPHCSRKTWHNMPCGLQLSSVCKLRIKTKNLQDVINAQEAQLKLLVDEIKLKDTKILCHQIIDLH